MYISMYDIGLFIVILLILVIGGYLIAVLRQAFYVFDHVRGILSTHKNDIGESLSLLPEVLVNINALNVSLKGTADQTSSAFRSLQHDVTNSVDSLQDGVETIVIYAKVIGEIFRALFSKVV